MAKSGQKKAFEEETVLDRGPREELDVGNRAAVDYSAEIRAAAERPGVWLAPEIWEGLSKMSANVHDMRRNNWMIDENLRIGKLNTDNEYLQKAHETLLKREAIIEANKFNTQSEYDLEDKLEKGKRNGLKARDIVTQHYQDQQKLLNSQYSQSPFIYDTVNNYNDTLFAKRIVNAIDYDYAATEEQAKYNFGTNVNLAVSSVLSNPDLSIDDAMESLSARLGVLMPMVTDKDERKYLETAYNSLILAKAENIELQYKLGNISKEAATSALASLNVDYAKRKWTLLNTRGDGTQDEYEVTNKSGTQITNKIQSINTKTSSDTETIFGADTYLNLVDAEGLKDGKFTTNDFIRRMSVTEADQYYLDAVTPLLAKAANGNKTAATKAEKIMSTHYNYVRPGCAISGVLRAELASGKSMSQAIANLRDRINTVREGIWENPNASFEELIFNVDGVIINLNMPTASENSQLWSYYAGNGASPSQARLNYYTHLINAFDSFTKGDVVGNLVIGDTEVSKKFNAVKSGIGPNVAVITDAKTGMYSINYSSIPDMTRRKQEWKAAYQSASGGRITNMPVTEYVKAVANEYSTVDLQTKLLGYAANGMSDADAGITDMYLGMNFDSLSTNDEKEAANMIVMGALLRKSGNTGKVDRVQSYIVSGGQLKGKYSGDADGKLKDLLRGNNGLDLGAYVDSLMDSYHIPASFRPALRYTLTNIALAEALGPGAGVTNSGKKIEGVVDVSKELDEKFMSVLFSKNGTFKFLNVLKENSMSADYVDGVTSKVNNTMDEVSKRLGTSSRDIRVAFNNTTGYLEIDTGYSQGVMYGLSSTAGEPGTSGSIPIVIDITNKPGMMDDTKYSNAIAQEAQSLATLCYVASAESQKYIGDLVNTYNSQVRKKGMPELKYEDVKQKAIQALQAGLNMDNQAGYIKYYNSNYSKNGGGIGEPDEGLSWIMNNLAVRENKGLFDRLTEATAPFASTNALYANSAYNKNNSNYYAADKYLGYMEAHTIAKNTINKDFSFVHTSQEGDTANLNEAFERRGFKITDTVRHPGDKNYNKYSHHADTDRTAFDVGCDGGFYNFLINGEIRTDVLDNFQLVMQEYKADVKKVLFTRKEFWTKPQYKKYREMRNKDGQLLFTNKDNSGRVLHDHDDHMHVTCYEPVYDYNGNFISTKTYKAQNFVKNMTQVIQHNTNEQVPPSTAKALVTLWPNYKPDEFDAKICGESVNSLNSSDNMRMTAIGKRYAYLRSTVFKHRPDYAFAAMAGVKFKLVKKPGAPKGLKDYPTELYTINDVLKMHYSKGINFEYYMFMPDYTGLSTYSKKCLDSARKMGAY